MKMDYFNFKRVALNMLKMSNKQREELFTLATRTKEDTELQARLHQVWLLYTAKGNTSELAKLQAIQISFNNLMATETLKVYVEVYVNAPICINCPDWQKIVYYDGRKSIVKQGNPWFYNA